MRIDLECSPGYQKIGNSGGNPCVKRSKQGFWKLLKVGLARTASRNELTYFGQVCFFLTKPDYEVVRRPKLVDQSRSWGPGLLSQDLTLETSPHPVANRDQQVPHLVYTERRRNISSAEGSPLGRGIWPGWGGKMATRRVGLLPLFQLNIHLKLAQYQKQASLWSAGAIFPWGIFLFDYRDFHTLRCSTKHGRHFLFKVLSTKQDSRCVDNS